MDFNTYQIEAFNKGGLVFASKEVIILTELYIDVMNQIIQNEKRLNLFKKSTTNRSALMNIIKVIMNKRFENCFYINLLLTKCSICKTEQKSTMVRQIVNTSYNVVINNF